MAKHIGITVLAIGALLCASCGEDTASPPFNIQLSELDGLRLEIDIERTAIPVGDSGVITMRLRNLTSQPKRLGFGSACQIMPYIENRAGVVQYPGGGAWACAAIVTSLDVPAHGVVTRTLTVRGVQSGAGPAGPVLPPGAYRVYSVLEGNSAVLVETPTVFQLRSPTVSFEVR